MHREMKGNDLIKKMFQGKLKRYTKNVSIESNNMNDELEEIMPFTMLTLDVPPTPLFQDEIESNIIPQVSILELFENMMEKRKLY